MVNILMKYVHFPNSFLLFSILHKSRDSSVGIALGYGLDDHGSRVWFPAGAGNFSLHHRVQNGSGAHPASCPMGTRGNFPGSKAAGAWSWPPPSNAEVKSAWSYTSTPLMSSWRGDKFTFTIPHRSWPYRMNRTTDVVTQLTGSEFLC
jgi:hypothetical protein